MAFQWEISNFFMNEKCFIASYAIEGLCNVVSASPAVDQDYIHIG